MRIAAQRIAVEAAEEQVRVLRADVTQKSVALKSRAQRRWFPAALLGVGGLLGVWLDGRVAHRGNSGSSGKKVPAQPAKSSDADTSPITPVLSALATVSMLVKVWRDIAPIAEHFMQRSGRQTNPQSSSAASTASEPQQVTDAPQSQR